MKCSFCGSEMIEKVEYEDEELKRTRGECSNEKCNTWYKTYLRKKNEELRVDLRRISK